MRIFFTGFFLIVSFTLLAQDELLKELEQSESETNEPVLATFSGTRLANGHSIETRGKGILDFIITHRFGRLNSGAYELFGLDNSSARIGLEYAISDRFNVGIGRSSSDKTIDYFLKYKVLQQADKMPVTITALGTAAYLGLKNNETNLLNTSEKMAYVGQLLIARKFSPRVSLQLAPAILHRATVNQDEAVNNLISLGMGGRVKITKSLAVLLEYSLRLNENANSPNYDALGVCVEFETGGHVFQLVFTNAMGIVERQFMAETIGNFFDGDIHFGFNITRAFQLGRKK